MGFRWMIGLVCGLALAQDAPVAGLFDRQADVLARTSGLFDRLIRLQSPAASTLAIAQLGAATCPYDRQLASKYFQHALITLGTLRDKEFSEAGPLLPVTSFAALTKYVIAAASKCDPLLGSHIAGDRVKEHLDRERMQANSNVGLALSLAPGSPDRAAQLLDAALSVQPPRELDIVTFTRALSQMRDPAPDLADEIFSSALQAADGAAPPDFLAELGNYLFVDPGLIHEPDREQKERIIGIGTTTVFDFRGNRISANPDEIIEYFAAVARMVNDPVVRAQNPIRAYALAYQMAPRARAQSDTSAGDLEKGLAALSSIPEARSSEVMSQIGARIAAGGAEDGDIDPEHRPYRMIGRFKRLWMSGNFDAARRIAADVPGQTARSQLLSLVSWAEATKAIKEKKIEPALQYSQTLPAGIRQILLYIGAATITDDATVAADELNIAWTEADKLPVQHRTLLLTAIALRMLDRNMESGYSVLSEVVKTLNGAAGTARTAGADPTLLVRRGRGVYEYVRSGAQRYSFLLDVPGTRILDVVTAFKSLKSSDFDRLEAIASELQEERYLGPALAAIAGLRLEAAKRAE